MKSVNLLSGGGSGYPFMVLLMGGAWGLRLSMCLRVFASMLKKLRERSILATCSEKLLKAKYVFLEFRLPCEEHGSNSSLLGLIYRMIRFQLLAQEAQLSNATAQSNHPKLDMPRTPRMALWQCRNQTRTHTRKCVISTKPGRRSKLRRLPLSIEGQAMARSVPQVSSHLGM